MEEGTFIILPVVCVNACKTVMIHFWKGTKFGFKIEKQKVFIYGH